MQIISSRPCRVMQGESEKDMTAEFNGIKVKIPHGYSGPDEHGFYMNGHGVEYALVSYGTGEDKEVCLETVYSNHVRTIRWKG